MQGATERADFLYENAKKWEDTIDEIRADAEKKAKESEEKAKKTIEEV